FFVKIFFFQAEDGIRDFHVTGVQTCALPIFLLAAMAVIGYFTAKSGGDALDEASRVATNAVRVQGIKASFAQMRREVISFANTEIGRAACRDRELYMVSDELYN